jgi:transcriptional regulator with XRE-family HTH domain
MKTKTDAVDLKTIRETFSLSQRDLADITGLDQRNISSLETGRRPLTQEMKVRIESKVQEWHSTHATKAEKAVQAAFSNPKLVRLREYHLAQMQNSTDDEEE